MTGARRALAFLTPVGGAAPPSPEALVWFPFVGAALGALLGLLWWGSAKVWPPVVAASLVVVLDLVLTGLLHLDGLVDAADGLLPHLSRDRRLEVMREPTVGAFGVGAGAAALLLRWAALTAIAPSVLLLAGLWTGARTAMVWVIGAVPYARVAEGGLPSAFSGGRRGPLVLAVGAGGCLALAFTLAWWPLPGAVSLLTGCLAAAGVVWLASRRVGGYTGDVLGAAGVVLETTALVVAAAKW